MVVVMKIGRCWLGLAAIVIAAVLGIGASEPSGVPADQIRFTGWDIMGPAGGDVRVVSIDPRNKDHLIASTLDGQIHASYDAGATWRLLASLNKPQLVIDDLEFDVQDPNIIFAAGHRHKDSGGFFKSADGGKTWKEIRQMSVESIHAMTQSTKNPDMIVLGAVSGVWASYDRGETFTKIIRDEIPTVDSLAVDPRNADVIYAGTWWRMYKTTDGGQTWRLIKNGMIDDSDVFAIDIDRTNPDHIIASACSGIYESFNAGELWKKIQGIPSQSRRTRDILQNPGRPSAVYAATTEGFWMSADGGATWSITTGKDLEINSIAVHPSDPDRIFIGTNNFGIMVSTDGGKNFRSGNGNFTSRFTYTITIDVEKPNRLYATTHNTATGGGFVFHSDDSGVTWNRSSNFDFIKNSPFALIQDRVNPMTLYMATSSGIFRSVDRGLSWSQMVGPKAAAKSSGKGSKKSAPKKSSPGPSSASTRRTTISVPAPTAPVNTFVATLTDRVKVLVRTEDGRSGLIAGTDRGLYRTYDPAKGWEKFNLGYGVDSNIQAVYVNPAAPQRILVGTAMSGLLISEDAGRTWVRSETVPKEVPISSIAGDPTRPERIFIGTVQTFYVSRDGGKRFIRRGGNLPLGNYTSIVVNPKAPDEVLISSALEEDGGMYFSADSGWTWRRVDTRELKLPTRRFWAMTIDPLNPGRIFVGTHSSGIYRIEAPLTGSVPQRPRTATVGN